MTLFNANPLISVIVPAYNIEKYISQCIDSLLCQTYRNIEIIIIDDGSTDNTPQICDGLKKSDSRIIVVHQNNSGVSAARNKGLELASGQYIMFVDGDDWLDTDTCEAALNQAVSIDADVVLWPYIREYPANPVVTAYWGTEALVWKGNGRELFRRAVGPIGSELRSPERVDSAITVWGKLYKAEIVKSVMFEDMKKIVSEDLLFTVEAFKNVRNAIYVPNLFYHYRKENDTSLTHTYRAELSSQWISLHEKIENIILSEKAGDDFKAALDNRIALRAIGLGLNVSCAENLSAFQKLKMIRNTFNNKFYRDRIVKISVSEMPIHWKVYYLCLKYKLYLFVYILLKFMNLLRKR